MGLQAIETVYKGYRFRSRLEARWAVFFDQMGFKWKYEDQGFELPCGRYLPDFEVECRGRTIFVEVKPSPGAELPRVYWAGRMKDGIRPFKPETPYRSDNAKRTPRRCKWLLGNAFIYTGPYTYALGQHSFRPIHGGEYEDMGGGSSGATWSVLNASFQGIRDCTIFFALIEDKEAYGTLVEIGYAAALGKWIVLGFSGDAIPENDKDCIYGDPSKPFHGAVSGITPNNDLWFAARAADSIYCGDRDYIFTQFSRQLASHASENGFSNPRRNELQLCNDLANASERPVLLVYGDPVDALLNGAGTLQFGGGEDVSELWTWAASLSKSATAARQARFEHGQSGAPYAAA